MENARYLYSDSPGHLMVIGCDRETNVNNSACVRMAAFSTFSLSFFLVKTFIIL
jgi:hypothetical protein